MAHRLCLFGLGLLFLLPARISAQPPTIPPQAPVINEVDRRIEIAFGQDAPELRRQLRFLSANRGIVVAANEFKLIKDNQVQLIAFSAAKFNDKDFCINLVRGDSAILTIDRQVTKVGDIAGSNVLSIDVQVTPNFAMPFEPQPPEPAPPATIQLPVPAPRVVENQPAPPTAFAPQPMPPFPHPTAPMVAHAVQPPRFSFKIDSLAPVKSLLPTPPKTLAKLPVWTNEDLAKVPEVTIGEPISKTLTKDRALEETAHLLAKMNHLNRKKTDGFMIAMIEQRADLRGLPFLMGEECRTNEEQARVFSLVADHINQVSRAAKQNRNVSDLAESVIQSMNQLRAAGFSRGDPDAVHRALVAAGTQILMPESDRLRVGLARSLAMVPHVDATKALARLAIFSPEDEVRAAALDGLKTRREKDYTDILMQGFRYPLPAVSKRAADALIKLERKDLLANLVDVLEQPDPRLPVTQKQDGKEVTFVRELVKINHHRNCALCHAPGNTENVPEGILKVAVPLTNEPLPKPVDGGYQSVPPISPDIVVRLDMTYLRQDFSVMMPVSDPHPWPEMQQLDFLVRTRVLTPAEAQTYEPCCDEPGRLSPFHRSALFALRELTGRDTEPTAKAWRNLLKLPAAN